MHQLLIIIKCFVYVFFCGCQSKIYYYYKFLGFKFLGIFSLYERKHFRFLNKVLPNGSTSIDAGAHLGIYTKLLAKKAGKIGKVIAIEPSPHCFTYLRNTFNKNPNVEIYQCAIDDNNNTCIFLETPLLCGIVPEAALARVVTAPNKYTVPVETKTIDYFTQGLNNLAFIKADIEGHELNLFTGASETIRLFRPLIMFEDNLIEKNLLFYRQIEKDFGFQLCILTEDLNLILYNGQQTKENNFYLRPID